MSTEYTERLRKQGLYELSYEPKSFWEYSRGNSIDKLVNDTKAFDFKDINDHDHFIKSGRGTFLSKFNSENCKNIINYFTCKGDTILDPFAGRTRAIISNHLDRKYVGFELTEKYFPAESTADRKIFNMDSGNMSDVLNDSMKFDLVFTCPPYWNMEKYSKDENDLSTFKTYDNFLEGCNRRLETASQYLKDDGFLIVVLMDFRQKGVFYPWHTDTINFFHKNTDFKLYDTMIWEMSPAKRHPLYPQALVNRRMLNTHEYCLVFNRKTQPELREFYDKKLNEDEKSNKQENGFWV